MITAVITGAAHPMVLSTARTLAERHGCRIVGYCVSHTTFVLR